jgi:hypothetical protein
MSLDYAHPVIVELKALYREAKLNCDKAYALRRPGFRNNALELAEENLNVITANIESIDALLESLPERKDISAEDLSEYQDTFHHHKIVLAGWYKDTEKSVRIIE